MAVLQIPFSQGQSEGVDPKVLPQGLFRSASNVRIRRDGRIGKRNGYAAMGTSALTGTFAPTSPINALTSLGNQKLYVGNGLLQVYSSSSNKWSFRTFVPTWSPRKSRTLASSLNANQKNADTAHLSNGAVQLTFYCWQVGTSVRVACEDAVTGAILFEQTLTTSGDLPRLVVGGSTRVYCVWMDGTTIKTRFFDIAAPGSFDAAVYTLTGTAVAASGFDVHERSGTSYFYLAYQFDATTLVFAYCDTTLVGFNTYAVANDTYQLGMGVYPGGSVFVAARAVGLTQIQIYSSTLACAAIIGPTVLITSAQETSRPAVVATSATTCHVVWSGTDAGGQPHMRFCQVTRTAVPSHTVGGTVTQLEVSHASKPWIAGTNPDIFIWAVSSRSASLQPSYYMLHINGASTISSGASEMHMRYAYGSADRSIAHWSRVVNTGSGWAWAHSRIAYGVAGAAPSISVDALKVNSQWDSVRAANRPSAQMGPCRYFASGVVMVFDGLATYECGFPYYPENLALAPLAGGSLTAAGSYQYTVTYEWIDAQGQLHRSEPAPPVSITLAGANQAVAVSFTGLELTSRGPMSSTAAVDYVVAHVWRTTSTGRIFYRVSPDTGATRVSPGTAGGYTYNDLMSDATARTKEVLYTQGGVLPHAMPPAAQYIAAGKDRLLIGGLAEASKVVWSKLYVPGEPVQWADHAAFEATVPGDVTAVAALDQRWIVFTATGIYESFGDGPDDRGAGSFQPFQRIPSEVGCIDHRSVLEVPAGLLFQGLSDRIYLLPRSGGAPVWVSQAVRTTMETFTEIRSCALSPDRNEAVFVASNGSGASRILVFDTRTSQWMVDTILDSNDAEAGFDACTFWGSPGALALARYQSALRIYQSSGFSDEIDPGQNRYLSSTLETGDIRPFGALAFGRCRKVDILGEWRADCRLTVAVSYDSGQTWPYSRTIALTGLTVGDSVSYEFFLPRQKGGSFRFRLSDTAEGLTGTEGFVYNGIALEVKPRSGLPRLQQARRG